MKQFKSLGAIYTLFLLICLSSCGIKGSDPNSLLREAGLKINDYEIVYKSDNLERESSAWDYYEYSLKIKDSSTDLLEQLKNLVSTNENWTKTEGQYIFTKEKEDNYDLSIYVNVELNEIHIEYMEYNIFS